MMPRVILLAMVMVPGAARAAEAAEVAVPASPDWSPSLLLVLTWLLAAILIIGPLVRMFRLEPKNPQVFSDDPPAPR